MHMQDIGIIKIKDKQHPHLAMYWPSGQVNILAMEAGVRGCNCTTATKTNTSDRISRP